MGVSRQPCFYHSLLWLQLVLCCGRALSCEGHVKRQYLAPAPEILPAPVVEPAPVILPAGIVEPTGAIAPAGLIGPAPLIAPAPAILPADAIKEKDRAYPGPKGKRYDIPVQGYGTQSMDSLYNTNQYPMPQYSTQDNLIRYGDLQQGQYEPWRSGSSPEQREPLNYFDPGLGTQTAIGPAITPPRTTYFYDQYSDIIKGENDLARSLVREIDQEGSAIASDSGFDNLKSAVGQAVGQGLVTAQGLSANELKNKPITKLKGGENKNPKQNTNKNRNTPQSANLSQNVTHKQVDNTSATSKLSGPAYSEPSGNLSSSTHVSNTNKPTDSSMSYVSEPYTFSSAGLKSSVSSSSSSSSSSPSSSPPSSSSSSSSLSSSSPPPPSSSLSSSPSSPLPPSPPSPPPPSSSLSQSSSPPSSSPPPPPSSSLSQSSSPPSSPPPPSSLSSSPSSSLSSSVAASAAATSNFVNLASSLPAVSNSSMSSPVTSTSSPSSFASSGSTSSLSSDTHSSFEPETQENAQISPSHSRNNESSALLSHSPQTLSKINSRDNENTNSGAATSRTGDKRNLEPSVAASSTHDTSDAASDTTAFGESGHPMSTREKSEKAEQVSQHTLGTTNIPSKLAATNNQHGSLSSIISASEQRLKPSDVNKPMPAIAEDKTPPRSESPPPLVDSKAKLAKTESEFRHLKHAGAILVPSKVFAPFDMGGMEDLNSEKTNATQPPCPCPVCPCPTMSPAQTANTLPNVWPTQTYHIRVPPHKEEPVEKSIPKVHPTQSGYIPQSDVKNWMVSDPLEKRLDEAKLLGMLAKATFAKYLEKPLKRKERGLAEQAQYEAKNVAGPIRDAHSQRNISQTNGSKYFGNVDATNEKAGKSSVDLKSLFTKMRHSLPLFSKKSSGNRVSNLEKGLPNLVSKRSLAGYARTRRQVLVPVSPLDNNPQPFASILTPPQPIFGPNQPVFPVLPQIQQPVQPDMYPQSFIAPPPGQTFPVSPLLAQPALAPVGNQGPPIAGFQRIMQFLPQRNEIGLPQPLPQVLPQSLPQAVSQPQQFLNPMGYPSSSVNVPLPSPDKVPSIVAATQAYTAFQDLNSRARMLDDVLKSIGGDERYNDAKKYDYANREDAWSNSDTKDYNGKRGYGDLSARDFDFSNQDGDSDKFNADLFHKRDPDFDDGWQPYTESEDDYAWKPRKAWNRPEKKFIMNDGSEEYDEGAEIVGRRIHPADETTENAIKERSSKETGRHIDDTVTSYDSDHTSYDSDYTSHDSDHTSYDNDHTSHNYAGEDMASPSRTDSYETDPEDESEDSKQIEAPDKKIDQHSDLKDYVDEDDSIVTAKQMVTSPAHTSVQRKDKSGMKDILERLNTDSVMHLNFNRPLQSHKNMADDQSGNGNDADLANGATISIRNFGTCGHGVDLNRGEIVYHSKSFTRKPTRAVSIAMWVKSRKPGLVRWFDFGDSAEAGKSGGGKPVTVPKNRWTHLAGTFETHAGVSRVYVDGDLLSERVGKKDEELPQDFTATGLGHKFGDEFIAFLDDLYMFDRVISPEEVKTLYKKCEFNRMILHFGFQKVNMSRQTLQLQDQSGLENNASITGGAHIITSGCDKCGACLDASSGEKPGVFLDGKTFRRKPTSAVTIAAWISLNRTKGLHSIFQTLDDKDGKISIYNMEVVNGRLHWKHKGRDGESVFDMTTEDVVVPENLWIHVAATYNSTSGTAKLYVNGIQKADYTNSRKPTLWSAWGRVAIGGHLPENSVFNGLLDEVFIYNWELDPSELLFVMKYCADHPKLVSFTVRVPIYKRQKIQGNHQSSNGSM